MSWKSLPVAARMACFILTLLFFQFLVKHYFRLDMRGGVQPPAKGSGTTSVGWRKEGIILESL